MSVFRLIAAASLLVASCLLEGCSAVNADPAEDGKLWQGTWKMESYTWNGMTPQVDMQWIVADDHYNIILDGKMQHGDNTFTLDPASKHVDVSYHAIPGASIGGSAKGIYEIHGDSLKLCYDLSGRAYPKSFDAPARSTRAVFVLHRVSR